MEPRQESRKKENGKKESGKIRQADTLREVMHHLGRYRIFLVFSILLAAVSVEAAVNRVLAREVAAAQAAGLTVLFCMGEREEEVDSWEEVLTAQLTGGLEGADLSRVRVAYEPVWSIGRWVYHKDTMKLTCEGEKVDIQPQPLRLFCAFMLHGGYLSYADINEALGWHESSLGLDSRRKRAISTLRTVLREKDARIQIKHEEGGYRISVTD